MNTFTRRDFIQQTAVLTGGLGCAAVGSWTGAANRPEISPDALTRLREKLKGRLVLASDTVYESARRVFYWNPKTEQKPLAVVQCGHEEDAVRAVEFARQFALEPIRLPNRGSASIRSGG